MPGGGGEMGLGRMERIKVKSEGEMRFRVVK